MSRPLNKDESAFGNARVAVLIVHWQNVDLLQMALEHVVDQETIRPDIFVLDNGSKEALPDEWIFRFPTVRFYSSPVNLGFAGGNNYLLDKTRDYAWIALVNPDAFLQKTWLKRMFQAASNYPRYAFFASRLIMADRPGMLDGEGDVMNISGLAWRKNYGLAAAVCADKPEEAFAPCAAAALYRRDALNESGTFDEAYFCYFEDVDLGFRLRLGGHRCLFVPDAVAAHVGSAATGGRHSDFAIYHGHRNLVWTYVKNMPGILFWLLLPLHILLNLVTLVWFCGRGKGRLIVKAKHDALRGIPDMWKKRRDIQRRRKASIMEIWKALDKSVLPRLSERLHGHL